MARKLRALFIGVLGVTAPVAAQEIGSVKALTYEVVLRGDADPESRPIARLSPGTPIKIKARHEARDWFYVSAFEREGWLPASALENNPNYYADIEARKAAERTARDIESLSSLARWGKYLIFAETDVRAGSSTLRDINGVLLNHYRSWGFIGAGVAHAIIFKEQGMAFMGEGLIEGQRESIDTHNETIWSWSLGVRGRLLKGVENDLGVGGFIGLGFQFSGYPEEKVASGQSANSVRIPMGATIAGGFGQIKEVFWFFDVFLEVPTYPNVGATFRVAWNWH